MKKLAVVLVMLLLMSTTGIAFARPFGRGGMMSWYSPDYANSYNAPSGGQATRNAYGTGMGPWMMGYYGQGYGGMMSRYGYGGCPIWNTGWGYTGYENQANITMDEAVKIAENYLSTSGYSDLKIDDVYEFNTHFEVELVEKSTNLHAFEILISQFTGAISPEMGPNTMWNTKYGHTNYAPIAKMSITAEQARDIAKNWLASYNSNLTLSEETEVYYGYYELHFKQDGRTAAQINVNGFTGQVWLERWHGILLNEKDV